MHSHHENKHIKPRVLIVEDEPVNAISLQGILDDSFTTTVVDSGEKALAHCDVKTPDAILMDIQLGGLDGIETCQLLKQSSNLADIPIIFISSDMSVQTLSECWISGAADVMHKPVLGIALITKLNQLCKQPVMRSGMFDLQTRTYSRHFLEEMFDKLYADMHRNKSVLSVISVEVKDNCTDQVTIPSFSGKHIEQTGKALRSCFMRPADIVGRYTKDQFVCLLPVTDKFGVEYLSGRVTKQLRFLESLSGLVADKRMVFSVRNCHLLADGFNKHPALSEILNTVSEHALSA